MSYDETNLPRKVVKYLDEINSDKNLKEAFYYCDVDIYDVNEIIKFQEDQLWFEDMCGPGEPNYDIKPFARDASGGLWVVLNNEKIGYIGTEGECGIVARNIDEFMNVVSTLKSGFISELSDEKSFYKIFEEQNKEYKSSGVLSSFIEKNCFEKDPSKIYHILKLGMTAKPFFLIKGKEGYLDSYSLFGLDDGQKSLEKFIKNYCN